MPELQHHAIDILIERLVVDFSVPREMLTELRAIVEADLLLNLCDAGAFSAKETAG